MQHPRESRCAFYIISDYDSMLWYALKLISTLVSTIERLPSFVETLSMIINALNSSRRIRHFQNENIAKSYAIVKND